MLFKLPEIDRKRTKEAVESVLEKYRIYLLTLDEKQLPKVTQTFSLVPPSNTNTFHSSTEEVAIRNTDHLINKIKYIKNVMKAINRLSALERRIIIERYLEEDMLDYILYNEMGLSERQYYRIKSKAFYKLALILGVEVMVENAC